MINISYYKEQTIHTWKFEDKILAKLEINGKERTFKVLSLTTEEEYHPLLPRLAKCLAKTLRLELNYKEEERLPPIDALLSQQMDPKLRKELIIKWVKNGGDPNAILFKEKKMPRSLVLVCYQDLELIEYLLENGLDPLHVCVTMPQNKNRETVSVTWTLAFLAAVDQRRDILELLIQKNIPINTPIDATLFFSQPGMEYLRIYKHFYASPFQMFIILKKIDMVKFFLERGEVDPNAHIFANQSALTLAAKSGNIELTKLLLESGARFASGEGLTIIFYLIPCNKAPILDLLLSYLPISSLKHIEELKFDDFSLFLKAVFKKKNLEPPKLDLVEKIYHDFRSIKCLGHKFGIRLIISSDLGFNLSTEGNTQGNIPFELELKESAESLFKKYPQFSSPTINPLIDGFCNVEELTLEKAGLLIEKFHKGEKVSVQGQWSGHHTDIFLYSNLLAICNRGHIEYDAKPGIQFYLFEDPKKLTPELLLNLHNTPLLISDGEGRKTLGLREQPLPTFVDKDQPGGFCSWNNRKLGFRLLLALAAMPEKIEGDIYEKLSECYRDTREIYKLWSKFDRDHTLAKILPFYEENPTIKPPIPLLLFVLANYKGEKREALVAFLLKQKLTPSDFLQKDELGKNPLHHLSSKENFQAFLHIMKQNDHLKDAEMCLDRLLCESDGKNRTPLLTALANCKHELAINLISCRPLITQEQLNFSDCRYLFSIEDLHKKTGLHYAIEQKNSTLITYFLEEMASEFFKTEGALEHYLLFAKERENPEAYEILLKLQKK